MEPTDIVISVFFANEDKDSKIKDLCPEIEHDESIDRKMVDLCQEIEDIDFVQETSQSIWGLCDFGGNENNDCNIIQNGTELQIKTEDITEGLSSAAVDSTNDEQSLSEPRNIWCPSQVVSEPYPGCRSIIRTAFMRQGVPAGAADIMIASLAASTLKHYDSYLKQWHQYCRTNNLPSIYNVHVTTILNFFVDKFRKGGKYGTLSSTKSALSLILGSDIVNSSQIKRFMRGVSRLRTPLPRYVITWDPSIVLDHLSSMYPNERLSFADLSKKLITLLALITAYRVRTLSLIKITNIRKYRNRYIIKLADKIKKSAASKVHRSIILPYFANSSVCPARTLDRYLIVSSRVRPVDCDFLIISYRTPFKEVGAQSLSRWIKSTLRESGVDTSVFMAHYNAQTTS